MSLPNFRFRTFVTFWVRTVLVVNKQLGHLFRPYKPLRKRERAQLVANLTLPPITRADRCLLEDYVPCREPLHAPPSIVGKRVAYLSTSCLSVFHHHHFQPANSDSLLLVRSL